MVMHTQSERMGKLTRLDTAENTMLLARIIVPLHLVSLFFWYSSFPESCLDENGTSRQQSLPLPRRFDLLQLLPNEMICQLLSSETLAFSVNEHT